MKKVKVDFKDLVVGKKYEVNSNGLEYTVLYKDENACFVRRKNEVTSCGYSYFKFDQNINYYGIKKTKKVTLYRETYRNTYGNIFQSSWVSQRNESLGHLQWETKEIEVEDNE